MASIRNQITYGRFWYSPPWRPGVSPRLWLKGFDRAANATMDRLCYPIEDALRADRARQSTHDNIDP